MSPNISAKLIAELFPSFSLRVQKGVLKFKGENEQKMKNCVLQNILFLFLRVRELEIVLRVIVYKVVNLLVLLKIPRKIHLDYLAISEKLGKSVLRKLIICNNKIGWNQLQVRGSNDILQSIRSSPGCKSLMAPATDLGAEWRRTKLDTGIAASSCDASLPLLRGLSPTHHHQHASSHSPFFNAKRKKYVYPITFVGHGESSVWYGFA